MRQTLVLLFVWLLLCVRPVGATLQDSDVLILDGERLSLNTEPLTPLLLDKRIALPAPAVVWTSNWRGYVATWLLADGRLVLHRVDVLLKSAEGKNEEAQPVDVLPRVFAGQSQVPAEWFSGTLIVPRGNVLRYGSVGYGSVYERYTVLHIRRGGLVSREDLSSKEFSVLRRQRFAAFKRTAAYAALLKDTVGKDMSPAAAEAFLYEFSAEEYMAVEPASVR